jgi:hypothetical protein
VNFGAPIKTGKEQSPGTRAVSAHRSASEQNRAFASTMRVTKLQRARQSIRFIVTTSPAAVAPAWRFNGGLSLAWRAHFSPATLSR